jgi:EmrB/QacA subfamily drug resistance transporter
MTNLQIPENVKKILLRIMSVILLMEMLDATVLNTSLPQIATSLDVNPIQLKEILTVYFLSLGVFIPVSGWAADRFGEKNSLLFAISLFTLSSIACGFAVNLPMLTVFRLLQGIGGAFLMPVGRQIIIRCYPGIARAHAMAAINILALLGLLLGPLIGGALTTYANWRWIFFINAPMGILGCYLIYKYLPEIREKIKTRFDVYGFILIGTALASTLFLIDILIDTRTSLLIKTVLLAIAIGSFLIYIVYARGKADPILNLKLFHNHEFSMAAIGNMLARLTLTAHPFLVPLLLQAGFGFSAIKSGLFTLPAVVGTLVLMLVLTRLLKRFNHRRLLILNSVLLLVFFCSFYWQAFQLMIPLLLVQQIVMGFLSGLQTALMNSNTYESLTDKQTSQGVTVNSGIIQVSGSFGIALSALTMIAVIGPNDLQHSIPLIAFKTVFIVQGLYLLIAIWFFNRLKTPQPAADFEKDKSAEILTENH